MAPTPKPTFSHPTNAAYKLIRDVLGVPQHVAARLIGMAPGTLSDLELGKTKKAIERKRLEEMVEPLNPAPGAVEVALGAIGRIRPDERADALGAYLSADLRADLESTAAAAGRTVLHDLLEVARERAYEVERAHAATVWKVLQPLGRKPAVRRLLIERTPGFATWALVEKLAHQSEKAAARDVEEALALGELGVWTADGLPDAAAFHAEAREYARVYLGNAHRVKGLFDEAFAAFARAKGVAPPEQGTPSPFSRARMLDCEASLQRERKKFAEALALQDRAFEAARPEELGFLWLSRATLLEQSNDPAGAIAALQKACVTLDERSEPRDRWGALFSLGVNLVELDRGAEAEALLPQIRSLAELRRDSLDLLRVLWLEGKVAAATGQVDQATAALDQVWRDFAAREITFDAALATLDLAMVYLSNGRLQETKSLARQTAAVFRAVRIEREELAAVRLFLEAAEREGATIELARQAQLALIAMSAPRGNSMTPSVGGSNG